MSETEIVGYKAKVKAVWPEARCVTRTNADRLHFVISTVNGKDWRNLGESGTELGAWADAAWGLSRDSARADTATPAIESPPEPPVEPVDANEAKVKAKYPRAYAFVGKDDVSIFLNRTTGGELYLGSGDTEADAWESAWEEVRPVDASAPHAPPAHYSWHPCGLEPRHIAGEFGYNVGTAMVYLWRAGRKTEDPVPDLIKARDHCDFEIDRLSKKQDTTP